MNYKSYAKINLFLDVVSRMKNGYHGIKSIFSEIDLYDDINFEKNNLNVNRVIDKNNVLPEVNLLTKASECFLMHIKKIPFGIDFHIEKNIPIGGGLGGGSSNASAVLKILNREWNVNFSINKLESIGTQIGADVPFFIKGGLQQVTGIGDRLKPLNSMIPDLYILMLIPEMSISTKKAYELIDDFGLAIKNKQNEIRYKNIVNGFKKGDFKLITNNVYNKFEEVIFKEFNEFQIIKNDILNSGAKVSFMSGSGSTMFGIYDTKSSLNDGMVNLIQKGHKCRPVMLKFK